VAGQAGSATGGHRLGPLGIDSLSSEIAAAPFRAAPHTGDDAMELDDFIDQALTQILSGIRKAQNRNGGAFIVAAGDSGHNYSNHPRVAASARLKSTIVDFDIAVTAEDATKVGGSGGLRVMGFGAKVEAGTEAKEISATRIQFAVPLLLPEAPRPWNSETRRDAPG